MSTAAKNTSAVTDFNGITGKELAKLLDSNKEVLLLDVRLPDAYQRACIINSINFSPCKKMLNRICAGEKMCMNRMISLCSGATKLKDLLHYDKVIVYDGASVYPERLAKNDMFTFLLKRLTRVFFLENGFDDFFANYPSHCRSFSQDLDEAFVPSLIMPRVYLGTEYQAKNPKTLQPGSLVNLVRLKQNREGLQLRLDIKFLLRCNRKSKFLNAEVGIQRGQLSSSRLQAQACITDFIELTFDIQYILSVTAGKSWKPVSFPENHYLKLPLNDTSSQKLLPFLVDAWDFIDLAVKRECNILVHCAAGVSRSAAIVVSYVMRRLCVPMDQALSFVKHRRSCIEPNFNFLGQLTRIKVNEFDFDRMEDYRAFDNPRFYDLIDVVMARTYDNDDLDPSTSEKSNIFMYIQPAIYYKCLVCFRYHGDLDCILKKPSLKRKLDTKCNDELDDCTDRTTHEDAHSQTDTGYLASLITSSKSEDTDVPVQKKVKVERPSTLSIPSSEWTSFLRPKL